jgi:hypothetical protein
VLAFNKQTKKTTQKPTMHFNFPALACFKKKKNNHKQMHMYRNTHKKIQNLRAECEHHHAKPHARSFTLPQHHTNSQQLNNNNTPATEMKMPTIYLYKNDQTIFRCPDKQQQQHKKKKKKKKKTSLVGAKTIHSFPIKHRTQPQPKAPPLAPKAQRIITKNKQTITSSIYTRINGITVQTARVRSQHLARATKIRIHSFIKPSNQTRSCPSRALQRQHHSNM